MEPTPTGGERELLDMAARGKRASSIGEPMGEADEHRRPPMPRLPSAALVEKTLDRWGSDMGVASIGLPTCDPRRDPW